MALLHRWVGWLGLGLALGAWADAGAGCKLGVVAELPVTMSNMQPIVTAKINGADANFVADSGAFYSMLSPAGAAEHKLKTQQAPLGLMVSGVGGVAGVSVATVKVFTLAGVPIPNVEFLVGGGEAGSNSVGLLGQNVFRLADVEYDLAHGMIRLIHEEDCAKTNLAYWAVNTGADVSGMDIQWTSPQSPHTSGTAFINGTRIHVIFDTGAGTSMVSLSAAKRAGISVDAPGVKYAGTSSGIGRSTVRTWIAPVASFKVGDEEIRNTHLRIGESVIESADMLIGADFFLSHRVYVTSKRAKLFFTYNGGPVFNLAVLSTSPAVAPAQAENAPADEPKDAAEFSRRGTALAARRDFAAAIADLTRAVELAPQEPNYIYERGIANAESGQRAAALADFDQALKLNPEHVPGLVARAEIRLAGGDADHAIEDLDAADRTASKEADARLRMAYGYVRAGRLPQAVAQLDLWIAAHRVDARMVAALNERCLARTLIGDELPKALDDCNAAVKMINKRDLESARPFNSRGLVRLRLGDYKNSIADYDASLAVQPKDAWALYGRGVAEKRLGKTAAADADMAAAGVIWPAVADAFVTHGIHP